MIDVRRFDSLGAFRIDWLDAKHHFSFGNYMDYGRMGWGPLRVWNDDAIQPHTGFDPHPHRDMEIITYVREGAISHEDHLGNKGRTEAGDVQVMSAGTGIAHAEYNREDDVTRIFQIWITPNRRGLAPRWEQRSFPKGEAAGKLVTLASGRPQDQGTDALPIHQDAAILGATLAKGTVVTHQLGDRLAYLVPAKGRVKVNGVIVDTRDGAAIKAEPTLTIEALDEAEILLADLPQAA
ncbi:MAG TPA: pirin family protein [Azospirillaceae bacterium]|nr:pirin family protein [Azospirillaceae bacterium]